MKKAKIEGDWTEVGEVKFLTLLLPSYTSCQLSKCYYKTIFTDNTWIFLWRIIHSTMYEKLMSAS